MRNSRDAHGDTWRMASLWDGPAAHHTLTLMELNSLVRRAIESSMDGEYWVEAELSECRESRGHCYMELVQRDDHAATPVARAQAKCWRTTWAVVQPRFEQATNQRLQAGMKVRLKVYAQFHEAYGFAWIVTDIDPTFTLGEQARRRQLTVNRLRAEGVFDLQRELRLPLFCQRIAVVSSASAAGYGDFEHQLADNERGLAFATTLFPATMQGEQTEQSIIAALDCIYRRQDSFDCVVIIRGGGATSDLSAFDTLRLAENVAQFPLPIITGIGHDRDESVLDMVSHMQVKTPTAAAAFLISHLSQVLDRVDGCRQRLLHCMGTRMETEQLRLSRLAERIPTLVSLVSVGQQARLDALAEKMATLCRHALTTHGHRLQLLQQRAEALDPALLLRRGYSITLAGGRPLRSARQVNVGDTIETRLAQGTLLSTVTENKNNRKKS